MITTPTTTKQQLRMTSHIAHMKFSIESNWQFTWNYAHRNSFLYYN